jgi:hypothetical protein
LFSEDKETTRQRMVLIPLVPRPLGHVRLLLHAPHAPHAPAPPPPPPPPAGGEAASDEEDAALALRFGFHV